MSGRAGSTRKRARPHNNNTRGRRNSNNSNNNNNNSGFTRNSNDPMQIKLKALATLMFGETNVNNMEKVGITPRKLWSLSTNITQCNNVIGTHHGKNCWICDRPIRNIEGLNPECEHILPVAQAVVFLSLYHSKRVYKNKNNKAGHEKNYDLVYDWAHKICNQEKSDICAIVSSSEGGAVVKEENIKYILEKIYDSKRKGIKSLKDSFKTAEYINKNDFIEKRKGPIMAKYQKIADFLNKDKEIDSNKFNLTLLAGVISAMDVSSIREEGAIFMNPEYKRKQEEAEKEMKELLTAQIKKDLRRHLGYGNNLESLTNIHMLSETIDEGVKKFVITKKRVEIKDNEELKTIIQLQIDKYKEFTLYSYDKVYTILAESQGRAYNAARIQEETVKYLVEFISAHIFSEISRHLFLYIEKRKRNASARIEERGGPVGDKMIKDAIQHTINMIEAEYIYKFLSVEYKKYYSTDNLNLLAELANAAPLVKRHL